MLREPKERETEFAGALFRNLCFRMLGSRSAGSRLARYIHRSVEGSPLDEYLVDMLRKFSEKDQAGFIERGSIVQESGAFLKYEGSTKVQAASSHATAGDDSDDEFEQLRSRDEAGPHVRTAEISPGGMMEMHAKRARGVFPVPMYKTLGALQPTSVPAERSFSVARLSSRASELGNYFPTRKLFLAREHSFE